MIDPTTADITVPGLGQVVARLSLLDRACNRCDRRGLDWRDTKDQGAQTIFG